MVPAVQKRSDRTGVGDIEMLPTVNTRLVCGAREVRAVGIVDTGADMCSMDLGFFTKHFDLNAVMTSSVRVVQGLGTTTDLANVEIDVTLYGDDPMAELVCKRVPVLLGPFGDRLVIGRRGLLEQLKVECDFPGRKVKLSRVSRPLKRFPSLSKIMPDLFGLLGGSGHWAGESNATALVWGVERYAMRVLEGDERVSGAAKRLSGHDAREASFGEALTAICEVYGLSDLTEDVRWLAETRNRIVHGLERRREDDLVDKLLQKAERVVSGIESARDQGFGVR